MRGAELYAELAQGGRFPLYRVFAQQNITHTVPPRTGLIVDGFAGTGIVTQLLREGGYRNEIVRIDTSREMLDKAKEFVGTEHTRFIPADMLTIDTLVRDASRVIASQGVHRVPEDEGGLPALLEAVYRSLRTDGAFVFNLDSTSIMLNGIPQLYEQEPYRIFFGEILPDVARQHSVTIPPLLDILTCQFSRFNIDRVLRFVRSSSFREASYDVMHTSWPRELLEQVHFPAGTPQMVAEFVKQAELRDRIIGDALERLSTHERYQQSWQGRSALPFYSVVFKAERRRS